MAVFCQVKKRELEGFAGAMDELKAKILICGHPDFAGFCEESAEACRQADAEDIP